MFDIEKVKDANTVEEMRAEISRLRYHDNIIHTVMDLADYKGLSAEDRFTILAYHLVKQNAELREMVIDYHMSRPMPMVIMPGRPLTEGEFNDRNEG